MTQLRKIYVASSWRNQYYPDVVQSLRLRGHEIYDFRNPESAFDWRQLDTRWKEWTTTDYLRALKEPLAQAGFRGDSDALKWCDTCVLVLPSGRSAHIEAGWAAGAGKRLIILIPEDQTEPELMYLFAENIVRTMDELHASL